jgi:SAM-dependent methyltransferase/tetratricopeptide (TPR) repeat protein
MAGVAALDCEDIAEAERLLRHAAALAPNDGGILNEVGRLELALGDPTAAAACFARATEMAPSLAAAPLNLGQVRLSQGRLDEAETALTEALRRAPDWPEAHDRLSRLYAALGALAEALESALRVLALEPDRPGALLWAGNLLKRCPTLVKTEMRPALLRLLVCYDIDPAEIAPAGWTVLMRDPRIGPALAQADGAALAPLLEADDLALALLEQAIVSDHRIERALCAIADAPPKLSAALAIQQDLNEGAWFAPTSTPPRPNASDSLAAHYERHPYPRWRRITQPEPQSYPRVLARFLPDDPRSVPESPQILVAGCGTGRHAALVARQFPQARLVAIDLSAASLDYAQTRCAELGIEGIDFRQDDLHDVAGLGQSFDHIECGGVLHHLPDPEYGWGALMAVLAPGGTMRIALYSRLARRPVETARAVLADLAGRGDDDDVLRLARRRIAALPTDHPARPVMEFSDFYSLSGCRDLLLHGHEDLFDLPRIQRALERFNLEFLGFDLPDDVTGATYDALFPHDPIRRDLGSWAAFEEIYPSSFKRMYQFWCRRAS